MFADAAAITADSQPARRVTKPLLMPCLAPQAAGEPLALAGLAAAWVGDLLLLPKHAPLAPGAAAFGATHLAYQAALWRHGVRVAPRRLVPRVAVWALAVGAAAATGKVKPQLVAGYGALLGSTAVLSRSGGGDLFLLSDGLLAFREARGKDDALRRVLGVGVTTTYCAAQYLLVKEISGARG